MSRGQQSQFYKTAEWVKCREDYMKSVKGLCEICKSKGLIIPAEIVHHKIHLNATNINNPNVTLNFNNLQAVCRKCHGELHGHTKRYEVMEDGSIIPH